MNRCLTFAAAALATALWATQSDAKEFNVGVHMPLTGGLARVGLSMWQGIQTAANLFNDASGGRNSVKLSIVDDESNPAKAVAAVKQLAPNVDAFTGGFGSNLVGPASETADRLGKVYVTGGAVADEIVARGLKGFFRVNNNQGYAKAIDGLTTELKIKSLSILYSTKDATTNLAQQVEVLAGKHGVKVTMHPFDSNTSDFKPLINKIKLQDHPQMIMMSGYENDYVGILRAAQILRPDVQMMVGVYGLATEQMNKDFHDLVQNVAGTAVLSYPPIFKTDDGKKFAESFKAKFGKYPDYNAVYGYVAAQMLFNAFARVPNGEASLPSLAAELRKTDAETLLGHVRFDERGDNPDFVQRIAQHQGDQLVLISPASAATGQMKLPGRSW